MAKKPVTVLGYEICTPKFKEDIWDEDRYDNEMIEVFLNLIMYVDIKDRAFRRKNKMINLQSIKQSDDADFLEGVFFTAKYGKEQTIIDVPNQIDAGKKEKNHGVKNEVNFLIHKRTGLLLIEKDSEGVARASMIQKFFRYHRELIYPYIEEFNKNNRPIKIYKNSFYRINSLPSKSFFDEIEEFSTVKEAFYYKDISLGEGANNQAADLMYHYNNASENGVSGVTRVKVSFQNKIPKGSVKHVVSYFQRLFESQNYDGIGVSGKLNSGRHRTIELENIQRAFDISVEHSDTGIVSLQDLIKEMVQIAKRDNPVKYKDKIIQFEGVLTNESEEDQAG
ncbi:hypothetical protein [Bacillus altitudinis]|uniref:hypothetical protein n=1 Tax=Bacillus altitudinis TaxID=293387 RepID=UPI000543F0BB|nr:hypothetical protein [Bacillus altitudinis]KWZ68341.1 hypothetical protein HQ51_0206550 [Bacillus altitudinis]UOG07866.1 hypothetical protein MTX65_00835 [Bacillus altitudinis]WRO26239.1 hypothetical protein SA286_00910 [Bacillus altitudinis]